MAEIDVDHIANCQPNIPDLSIEDGDALGAPSKAGATAYNNSDVDIDG